MSSSSKDDQYWQPHVGLKNILEDIELSKTNILKTL